MLTKNELAVIRERVENATIGKWEHRGDPGIVLLGGNVLAECSYKRDGLFIAHSRSDVPALLAHIEELEAKLQRALDYARCAEACEEYEGPVRWRWTDMVELLEGGAHSEAPEVRK